jgi:hypothetical protein
VEDLRTGAVRPDEFLGGHFVSSSFVGTGPPAHCVSVWGWTTADLRFIVLSKIAGYLSRSRLLVLGGVLRPRAL